MTNTHRPQRLNAPLRPGFYTSSPVMAPTHPTLPTSRTLLSLILFPLAEPHCVNDHHYSTPWSSTPTFAGLLRPLPNDNYPDSLVPQYYAERCLVCAGTFSPRIVNLNPTKPSIPTNHCFVHRCRQSVWSTDGRAARPSATPPHQCTQQQPSPNSSSRDADGTLLPSIPFSRLRRRLPRGT